MNSWKKIFKYELMSVTRNRWIPIHALLLAGIAETFLRVGGDFSKALVTLSSVTVVLVPLIALLFSSLYWYYSDRFTQLLLTLPMSRSTLYFARALALSGSLAASFSIGTALPFLARGHLSWGLLLLTLTGLFLTTVFVLVGSLIAIFISDRMKGLGAALGTWFYFIVIHDSVILFALLLMSDYPMDVPAGLLGVLNPIGLSRIALLLAHDASMLLGHTGALVRNLVASGSGILIALFMVAAWLTIPALTGYSKFMKRDF